MKEMLLVPIESIELLKKTVREYINKIGICPYCLCEFDESHIPRCKLGRVLDENIPIFGKRKAMKLHSTATTIEEFKDDVVKFLRLRAELERSAEKTVRSKQKQQMYLHAAFAIDGLADDIHFMEIGGK